MFTSNLVQNPNFASFKPQKKGPEPTDLRQSTPALFEIDQVLLVTQRRNPLGQRRV